MQTIINLLSVNTTFFTILGYNMSYIEFFGTILNIISVYLVSKNKILNWPIGIVASILFMFLFWQIQLYSDFGEQIYYVITGFWGWLAWASGKKNVEGKIFRITTLKLEQRIYYGLGILVGTILVSLLTANLHTLLPTIFTKEASYPVVDAFTTVVSFVATYLLIAKKVESWYLWILVDVIAVWLYYVKDVKFVALLYFIFLILATNGLLTWIKIQKSYENV